jgi:hypothetical protein
MTHKFDFKKKKHLDSKQRQKLLPPYELLAKFGLNNGKVVADIGAGTGYFSFPAGLILQI